MPSNATYPLMLHHWGELIYSFSGIVEVTAGDEHVLAPPQLGLWIPAETEHVGFNEAEAVHCSVYINNRLCERMPKTLCGVMVTPLVRAILEHLRDHEASDDDPAARARLLRVLVDQIANCSTTGSYIPRASDPVLDEVLSALKQNPADNRSIAELARAFHMSERTLIRRCEHDLGMSLTEWRQRLRLVTALPLLRTGRGVESVALDLGYATSSSFIAMFRRLMGTSPRQFVTQLPTPSGKAATLPARRRRTRA